MKKIFLLFFSMISIVLTGCSNIEDNSRVTVTFIQHTLISTDYDDNMIVKGYYFENDEIAKTTFEYEKGHYLTDDEIYEFRTTKDLKYVVPRLNGDGFWSYTFFTTNYDEKTKFSNNFMKEMTLNEDLIVYFAIVG